MDTSFLTLPTILQEILLIVLVIQHRNITVQARGIGEMGVRRSSLELQIRSAMTARQYGKLFYKFFSIED